jgi:fumarate reductase flavoprotein subunit
MSVLPTRSVAFDAEIDVAIVGGGACGLVAALAAKDAGAEPVVFERDARPAGSTALSSGMVPASATAMQRKRGVEDTPALMAADIQRKAHGQNDQAMVDTVARASGPTIDWLAARHNVGFELVEGFLYPGHSVLRMHALPERTGAALMGALLNAVAAAGIDIVANARVDALVADDDGPNGYGQVRGLRLKRPDGSSEAIACRSLVLACSGFGGDADMVARYIPEMARAKYFGHVGNQGDAVRWGQALGAAVEHMAAYQGHGSVAIPQEALISWALMMEGGFQVNAHGERFSNEHHGYSEQSVAVLGQPGQVAWNIYDARLHELGMTFEDYRNAAAGGAIRRADSIEALAEQCGLPAGTLATTLARCTALAAGQGHDSFGRDFSTKPALAPPYCAVKVTGALFHTQGGLKIDTHARVQRPDGRALPNLFAGGGAASGLSGDTVDGYLSGNGLLAAIVLGAIAGRSAARQFD